MKVTDFHFDLPESLISKVPVFPRDTCRLLVLHRSDRSLEHRRFFELPEFLHPGDLLLLNDTKVFPARLIGTKQTGGRLEILLLREIESDTWEILSRGKYTGRVRISDELSGEIFDGKVMRLNRRGDNAADFPVDIFRKVGLMPLPPYIKREPSEEDKEWYQTIYAQKMGSIAAPTAGLHFTPELIERLEEKGILIRFLTLHVGAGTFKPIKTETVEGHAMESECFEIGANLLRTMRRVKESGRRVITVGTTTTRAVEGYAGGRWSPVGKRHSFHPSYSLAGEGQGGGNGDRDGIGGSAIRGWTDIFIYPGYRFEVADSLITNFHLPGSTPLMLTSAFCGIDVLMGAYRSAMAAGYGFFSYGDAMLIL